MRFKNINTFRHFVCYFKPQKYILYNTHNIIWQPAPSFPFEILSLEISIVRLEKPFLVKISQSINNKTMLCKNLAKLATSFLREICLKLRCFAQFPGVKFNKPSCVISASMCNFEFEKRRKFGFQFWGFKVINGPSNNIKTSLVAVLLFMIAY